MADVVAMVTVVVVVAMVAVNLVPRAFPYVVGAHQQHREKPWERGWVVVVAMRVPMGVSKSQLTTNFRAESQLTTNFLAKSQLTTNQS